MAKAETKTETTEAPKPKALTHPPRFYFRAGERFADDEMIVPMGHSREELLHNPAYFSHSAKRIRPNTYVRYIAEDYSFGGTLLITRIVEGVPYIVSLSEWEAGAANVPADLSDLYKISQAATGFRIILKATGAVVKDELPSRRAAIDALEEMEAKARKAA